VCQRLWDEPDQTVENVKSVRHEQSEEAAKAIGAQKYMHKHYAERAGHRAFHARYATGDGQVRYAEAFQRAIPQVVRSL
jgi:4-oxalomesaconate hydratase